MGRYKVNQTTGALSLMAGRGNTETLAQDISDIQALIPSAASSSNQLLASQSNAIPKFASLTTSSTTDYPVIMNETATEDYKGIKVTMNDVQRYLLTFKNGHLYLTSYESDGTTKIVNDNQIDSIVKVTSLTTTGVGNANGYTGNVIPSGYTLMKAIAEGYNAGCTFVDKRGYLYTYNIDNTAMSGWTRVPVGTSINYTLYWIKTP